MDKDELYQELFNRLNSASVLSPDFPDETIESTLNALWSTAQGIPCSAIHAKTFLPEELTEEKKATLLSLVEKRIKGTPLAHLTGRVHFMGLEILFEPGIFLVRPETELLGHSVITFLNEKAIHADMLRMIDIGCGSGNLTCGIACSIKNLEVWSIDISEKCTALTKKNVDLYGLNDLVTVFQGDLFTPVSNLGLEGTLDAIICNPPYIATSRLAGDRSYLLNHEPREAFDGGPFGFGLHMRLIKEALAFLNPHGALFFEFGAGQHTQVQRLIERSRGYNSVEFSEDESGIPRVAIARKGGK
ncbi:MAG: HemK family protein methyltransferase [Candidatus Latescibacteria bacterium]|nr:HemK family protein methyltransferase [Candidatus Latescibacterota bacterium]